MADSIEELGFELSAGELGVQERALTGLKASAGTVVGAASIAGSFLAAKTSSGSLDAWALLALAAFVLCFGCAIWVLLPHELTLAIGGRELIADGDKRNVRELTEVYRAAVTWTEPLLQENRARIARLSGWLTLSCVLLGIEIVLWTASLVE
jgi:hypothetical protein